MTLSYALLTTAVGAPLANVTTYWPPLLTALDIEAIRSPLVEIAVAATVAVETGNFTPCVERGSKAYFQKYEPGTPIGLRLGNTQIGDGFKFRGRGFVQLTGRANYRAYGAALGIPLEESPELALQPDTSARILARYFRVRKVADAANAGNWALVRRRVNGGYHGWERYAKVVNALSGFPVLELTPPGSI